MEFWITGQACEAGAVEEVVQSGAVLSVKQQSGEVMTEAYGKAVDEEGDAALFQR